MSQFHDEKIAQAVKDVAATFIQRESNGQSLITVTRVDMNAKGDQAMIFISVFPDQAEETVMNFLHRNRGELKEEFKKRVRVGRIPFFQFEIDKGEKLRHKIDALL